MPIAVVENSALNSTVGPSFTHPLRLRKETFQSCRFAEIGNRRGRAGKRRRVFSVASSRRQGTLRMEPNGGSQNSPLSSHRDTLAATRSSTTVVFAGAVPVMTSWHLL